MIKKLILRILITMVAVLAVLYLVPGIIFLGGVIDFFQIVGIIFIANLLLRPILKLFHLPLEIATLGILSILINGLILWLIAQFFGVIKITSFWFSGMSGNVFLVTPIELPALITLAICASLISFVSTFLYWLTR